MERLRDSGWSGLEPFAHVCRLLGQSRERRRPANRPGIIAEYSGHTDTLPGE